MNSNAASPLHLGDLPRGFLLDVFGGDGQFVDETAVDKDLGLVAVRAAAIS